jgi:hypothetical protein
MLQALDEFCDHTDVLDPGEAKHVVTARDPRGWYLFNLALWWKEYFTS